MSAIEITSVDHFKQTLEKDLERVSVTFFYANWAEPCKQMQPVVDELAKKYENVLFLKVDAEPLPDIPESFEVESVPAFVVLRGHTLLGKVTGADTNGITSLVEQHATVAPKPLSTSDAVPAPPPNSVQTNGKPAPVEEKKEETTDELNERMRGIMNSDKVVLFMKGSPDAPRCGFSRKTVALLREQNVEFTHFDILQDEAVRQGLKVLNDWPTFPQLIIRGELYGGLDILREGIESGEFQEVLQSE